jgi:hypothetical protein
MRAHISSTPVIAALLASTTLGSSFAAETKLPNCQASSTAIQGSADWTQISPQVAPNVSVSISATGQWDCFYGASTCLTDAGGKSGLTRSLIGVATEQLSLADMCELACARNVRESGLRA